MNLIDLLKNTITHRKVTCIVLVQRELEFSMY